MIIQITGILLLSFVIISALTILIFSYDENEKRAVNISLFAAFMAGVFLMLVLQANSLISIYTAGTVSFLFLCTVLFLLLAKKKKYAYYPPKHKTDERRTMFSRAELKPGSANFNAYYKEYPNDFPLDQVWRKNPGLMSSDAKFFESFSFAAANASFHTVDLFKDAVNFTENKKKKPVDPKQMSKFLTNWAVHLGAHSAGITPLKSYHLYSRRGRGTEYGKPVNNQHTFALAFTVEMNKTHIDSAPKGPTLAESAKQYLNAGAVAMQLAAFINSFGYPARAHIDGNYEIMCPLVARDSGLGEIGRMGLLMTPILGPRVRIGAVTTDIPLIPNETRFAEDVIDFCSQCKKCAEVCPSKAIPSGEREEVQGVIRWQINQEACFNYWTLTGTDCARCVSVCPYSHENNLMHNIIRKGLRQSAAFRKIAIQADNWLYGKKPASKALPDIYQ